MISFLVVDLALNSILDYDLFNNQISVNNASHLLLGLLGFQTVVEISAFLILFVSMADSFLFRVGLLGLLMKKFRTVLIFHPIYIAITVASGALRVKHLSIVGNSLATLYRYNAYTRLSIIQKIGELAALTWTPLSKALTVFQALIPRRTFISCCLSHAVYRILWTMMTDN